MIERTKELLHLLGYVNEEQWKDAFKYNDLDKKELNLLKEIVEKHYSFKIEVD